jgi:hypothetical protein
MANNTNWIPIAISEADYQRADVQDNLAEILCDILGYPVNDECKAIALSEFSMELRENVVGNPDYNVTAGSNWYVSSDAIKNLIGDNIAQAQAKLDAAKLKPKKGDPLIGNITERGEYWFREWGVYSVEEPI